MLRRNLLLGALALPMASMLGASEAKAFFGGQQQPTYARDPNARVEGILVKKSERKMLLASADGKVVREYSVKLGFNPIGHKQFMGDGKTPEGNYRISHKNPYSKFHLSLGINYPNREDRAYAARHGKSPGGDIFIHGTGRGDYIPQRDWTIGCIAVTDQEMDEIFSLIRPGIPITITA